MSILRFRFLGGFEALGGETPLQGFISDKSRALLGYLIVESGRSHRREHLAGLFWPEKPETSASHSLSQAVYSLRKSIQDQVAWVPLLITPQSIQYQWDSRSWLDVLEFDGLLQVCEQHEHVDRLACQACLEHLENAFQLYRGDFHQGMHVNGCHAYQEWLTGQQESYRQKVQEVTQWLADGHWQNGSPGKALYYAHRLAFLDPFGEAIHRLILSIFLAEGKRNEALLHYENFRKLLNELGVEPEAETRNIYEQIISQT